ncbi:MAG: DUF1445 domain-containing protein, partial [Pseudomonadota bacterium]
MVLPEAHALDFLRFCLRNPRACPVVGVTGTGDARLPLLGGIDLRTDLPSYRLHEDGRPVGDVPDITDLWRDDLVGVAMGCSFTFEHALIAAGIDLRHVSHDRIMPMVRSAVPTTPAGPFAGPMV